MPFHDDDALKIMQERADDLMGVSTHATVARAVPGMLPTAAFSPGIANHAYHTQLLGICAACQDA